MSLAISVLLVVSYGTRIMYRRFPRATRWAIAAVLLLALGGGLALRLRYEMEQRAIRELGERSERQEDQRQHAAAAARKAEQDRLAQLNPDKREALLALTEDRQRQLQGAVNAYFRDHHYFPGLLTWESLTRPDNIDDGPFLRTVGPYLTAPLENPLNRSSKVSNDPQGASADDGWEFDTGNISAIGLGAGRAAFPRPSSATRPATSMAAP